MSSSAAAFGVATTGAWIVRRYLAREKKYVESRVQFERKVKALRDEDIDELGLEEVLRWEELGARQQGPQMLPEELISLLQGKLRRLDVFWRLFLILNALTTVGAALFIIASIVTYFFGHTQVALRLDIIGIILFVLKGLATGALGYVGSTLLKRAHEAGQKQGR